MPAGLQLSDGNPSGTSLGQDTSDLISLYGVTPVAQQTITCVSTGCVVATVLAKLNLLINKLKKVGIVG